MNDPKYAAFYGPAQLNGADNGDVGDLPRDFTYVSQAYMDDWLARTAEIVERYHPDLIYFDWWVGQPDFRSHLERFATYYYNRAAAQQQPVVLFYKLNDMAEGSATLDLERGGLGDIRPQPWQTDTSLSNGSWGYIEHDTYKSPEAVIHQLADVVSKNGNLLMNVGPRPDGTIPEGAANTLLAVGAWLKVNGDAIYGTRPWRRVWRRPDEVRSRLVSRHRLEAIHRRGLSLHDEGWSRSTPSSSAGRRAGRPSFARSPQASAPAKSRRSTCWALRNISHSRSSLMDFTSTFRRNPAVSTHTLTASPGVRERQSIKEP